MSETLSATADQITVAARAIRSATHHVALIAHGYSTPFFGFHGSRFKFRSVWIPVAAVSATRIPSTAPSRIVGTTLLRPITGGSLAFT